MSTLLTTTLHSTKNGSDKVYVPAVVTNPAGGFDVTARNGPRGGTLTQQKPKVSGVDEQAARAAYAALVADKVKGGYRPVDGESIAVAIATERDGKSANVPVELPNAVTEAEFRVLFANPAWRWQEKKNGHRRGLLVTAEGAFGYNRRGEFVPLPAPIAEAARALPLDTTLDGELIGDVLHVFDALRIDGADQTGLAFDDRFAALARLLGDSRLGPAIGIVPILTVDEALALEGSGAEGLVGRKRSARYVDGKAHDHCVKLKYYCTASVEVARQNAKHSVGYVVYNEGGEAVDVGNVTIPPTMPLPDVGVVIEVRYLYAHRGGSLYQPSFLMVRTDVGREACRHDQLVYQGEAVDAE